MTDILTTILKTKRTEVAAAKQRVPTETLIRRIEDMPRCRNFYRALTTPNPRGINVIAEIKRASPSAGLIRTDFDPAKLAQLYQQCGAQAISVLTDREFFQGDLQYINQVKQVVSLPVLRKDFIIDPYQIYESRVAGADAVLLIAEALEPASLIDLMVLAGSLTMTVLLETHSFDSLMQLRSMVDFPQNSYSLLGINNRDLKTMKVNLAHSLKMSKFVDDKSILISESGIRQRSDVERLIEAGFSGVLIGETLMRSDDIAKKFAELFTPSDQQNQTTNS